MHAHLPSKLGSPRSPNLLPVCLLICYFLVFLLTNLGCTLPSCCCLCHRRSAATTNAVLLPCCRHCCQAGCHPRSAAALLPPALSLPVVAKTAILALPNAMPTATTAATLPASCRCHHRCHRASRRAAAEYDAAMPPSCQAGCCRHTAAATGATVLSPAPCCRTACLRRPAVLPPLPPCCHRR
jgi:hypothetical protein